MKTANQLYNPMEPMLECFESSWAPVSIDMLIQFNVNLLSCGYFVECREDAYAIMGILKDMGLIDIQYTNNKPEKVMKL